MKALIAVDGSDGSFAAVRFAGRLLSAQDQIALYYSPPAVKAQHADASAQRACQDLATALFAAATEQLPEPLRANIHTIVGAHKPHQNIVTEASQWQADLIVVGARGVSTLHRLLLGSVSRSVVKAASVPVLVVRARADAPTLKLLYAYDGSPVSRHVADVLNEFTNWPAGTAGRIITVIEPLAAGEVPSWLQEKARDADIAAMAEACAREHEAEEQTKVAELLALREQLPEPFRRTEPLVAEGNPADQILRVAATEHVDMIALGKTGSGLWSRLLVGSTAEQVTVHAHCSVLVVPPKAK